jgi:hypothetical protein
MPFSSAAAITRSGFRPAKSWRSPSPSVPISSDVEEQRELRLGRRHLHRDGLHLEAIAARIDEEQRQPPAAGLLVGARSRDDDDAIGLVDGRRVDLLPLDAIDVAVERGGRREPVRVRSRVGLGDRERHPRLAGRHRRQPPLLLLGGSVRGEELAADRGRDDQQERGRAGRSELLADDRELRDPGTGASVFLRDVDAEVAVLRELGPQLGRLPIAPRYLEVIGVPVAERKLTHRRTEQLLLVRLDESVHARMLFQPAAW